MIQNDLQILFRAAKDHKQGAGIERTPIFHKHETVMGKVLRSYPSGTALLLIKGEKIHVRTHVPLNPGTHVVLQVKNLSPVPTLKYLGEKLPRLQPLNLSSILSSIKGNLWKTVIDSTTHSNLSRDEKTKILHLLETITGSVFKKPSSDLLETLIRMSGLNLEAKIKKALNTNISKIDMNNLIERDLKGLLSKLIGRGTEGRIHLKKLWTALEKIQLLNQDGLEQGRKIYLPIPMQLPDGIFSVAQLLLQLPSWDKENTGRDIKDGDVLKATFLLEMSRLGPIRAEFILREKNIEGMFLVVEKQTKEILDKNLTLLIDALSEKGFSINHVGCFLKDPETVVQPLLKDIVQEENNLICLVG